MAFAHPGLETPAAAALRKLRRVSIISSSLKCEQLPFGGPHSMLAEMFQEGHRASGCFRVSGFAIRLWHPCADVYVSNPQATVVARSDRHGAGSKRGRAVAEIHARARGSSADRV